MKRSEMVEEITEFIDMVRYEDAINEAGGASKVSSSEYADIFLKKIEEAGMVPPDKSWCHCEDCNGGPDHSWSEE